MTEQELKARIADLKMLAETLEEPEKTLRLNEINMLKMEIEGMALDDLNSRLEKIKLADIQIMDAEIAAAKEAVSIQQKVIKAFDVGIKIVKTALDVAL